MTLEQWFSIFLTSWRTRDQLRNERAHFAWEVKTIC